VLITVPDGTRAVAAALAETADRLEAANGPATLVSEALTLPRAALADLSSARPGASAAATTTAADGACAVHVLHHRVIDAATDQHPCPEPNAAAIGLVRLSATDAASAAAALRDAAQVAPHAIDSSHCFAWHLLALVRAGIVIKSESVDPWPWAWDAAATGTGVPADLSAAEAARIRLLRANRADDGVYSVAVLRRLSKPLSALAARRGWSPNALTLVSLAIGLSAAGLFATGDRRALVVGAVLLQLSLIVDCSDGEVARLTGRYSTVGSWLDASTDRVKEYAAYAGLAAGAAASTGQSIWWWAGATMALQTARHLADYTFHQVQVRRETSGVQRSITDTGARSGRYTGIIAASASVNRNATLRSIKKVVFLPIGERWLLISVTAALLTPWWTFAILLGAGILSSTYAWAGRVLRTRTWPRTRVGDDIVAPQADAGPVSELIAAVAPVRGAVAVLGLGLLSWAVATAAIAAFPAASAAGLLLAAAVVVPAMLRVAGDRFAWALPSALAACESAMWLVGTAVLAPGWAPWGFAVAGVAAFHRYDLLYRAMAGSPAPQWIRHISGGTDGRLIVMAALVFAGSTAFTSALPWLACYLALAAVAVASAQWLAQMRQTAP
jgi:hypothetical protein